MELCDDCRFVYADLPTAEISNAIRALAPEYRVHLTSRAEQVLRARPEPEVWSVLEYACHVRDVFMVQRERVRLALVEDCPRFVSMGREERVLELRYNEQEPEAVADEIDDAASELAATVDTLTDEQWQRTGIYTWPTEVERTMAWLGRHTVHEGIHHLRDMETVTL